MGLGNFSKGEIIPQWFEFFNVRVLSGMVEAENAKVSHRSEGYELTAASPLAVGVFVRAS